MERNKKRLGLIKNCLAVGGASFFALSLMLKLESNDSECVGKIKWDGDLKDVSICLNNEHRVVVQGPKTDSRRLPKDVCKLTQVWVEIENQVTYIRFISEVLTQTVSIDLSTGEILKILEDERSISGFHPTGAKRGC